MEDKHDNLKVYSSRDYSLFKTLEGNRSVNPLHLRRLRESMSKRSLVSPIIVNEKFEIIDGQHRFIVRRDLLLPILYIIVNGYGLNEVQILNSNSHNWSPDNYLEGYIKLGLKNYILFKNIKETYGLGHSSVLSIIYNGRPRNSFEDFTQGKLEIKDYKEAISMSEKIHMVAPYYTSYNTKSFVLAMVQCFNNPNYDHATFMTKVKYQSMALVKVANKEQAIVMITKIYNHRNPNKI